MNNKNTTGKKLLLASRYIILLVSFSFALLFWLTTGYGQYVKLTDLHRSRNHMLVQIAEMETHLESAFLIDSRYSKANADSVRLHRAIPSCAALSDILNNLAAFLHKQNVNIDIITVGDKNENDYYSKVKLQLTLSGLPDDINNFLIEFASMDQLLLVEDIAWYLDKNNTSALLSITCYLIVQNSSP